MNHTLATWEPGTTVSLCNVPWTSDYRDVVKFTTEAELDDYLLNNAGPQLTIERMIYAKPGMPVKINLPFNSCYKYNYLRVSNSAPNDTSRTFYYFIQDVEYSAPNTTILHIQLDVWQTFNRNVTFGNCYIERGHIGIANVNQMRDNGREFLTIPEGLDVGGEYSIEGTATHIMGDHSTNNSFDIIVATTISFEGSGGTVDKPVIKTARGSDFEGLPNGCELYWFPTVDNFLTFMDIIADMPWVSQGIISIMAVPNLTTTLPAYSHSTVNALGLINVQRLTGSKIPTRTIALFDNWREAYGVTGRYARLKKFMTYPYRVVEVTTYSGNPLMLKPESIGGDHISMVQLTHIAPPAPRVAFYPYHYNAGGVTDSYDSSGLVVDDGAEFLDMTTGIFNFPTFSLVNNGYMSYMAANSNSIAYQHTSADWSQQRALTSNTLGYDQSSASISTARDINQLQMGAGSASNQLANQTAMGKTFVSGAAGVIGGVAGGPAGVAAGAAGAATSGINMAIDMNQRNQQLGISQGLAIAQTAATTGNQGYMRDTNKGFADYAAQGDYQNTIAGINAKVQDAKLIQPTTSGQMGGDAFNLSVYRWALHAKIKVIQAAAMAAIGEYWFRYGYQINRFAVMPESLMVMEKFTYWKLRETYIRSSSCPEMYRQTIRGIFEKGVTVWATPNDIGMIDIANNPALPGVTL